MSVGLYYQILTSNYTSYIFSIYFDNVNGHLNVAGGLDLINLDWFDYTTYTKKKELQF